MVRSKRLDLEAKILQDLIKTFPMEKVLDFLKKELHWEEVYNGSFREVLVGPLVVLKVVINDRGVDMALKHTRIEINEFKRLKNTPIGKHLARILAYDTGKGVVIQETVEPACPDLTCRPSPKMSRLLDKYIKRSMIETDWEWNHSHTKRGGIRIFDLG